MLLQAGSIASAIAGLLAGVPSLIGRAAATAVVACVIARSAITLALLARDNRDNQQDGSNHHDDNRDEQILHIAGLRNAATVRKPA